MWECGDNNLYELWCHLGEDYESTRQENNLTHLQESVFRICVHRQQREVPHQHERRVEVLE